MSIDKSMHYGQMPLQDVKVLLIVLESIVYKVNPLYIFFQPNFFATEIESYNQDSYQRALKADEAIRINIGENTESKRKEREIELRKAS